MNLRELFGDRHLVARYLHLDLVFGAFEDFAEDAEQVEQCGRDFRVAAVGFYLAARIAGRFYLAARIEHLRRRFELLVFEQPFDQLRARVFVQVFLAIGIRIGREQHLRFDVNQRRGHHQKIARDGDVQLLHQLEIGQVLFGDARDRDVVDVDLVFLDQVEQQIKRPLEDLEFDTVFSQASGHLVARCRTIGRAVRRWQRWRNLRLVSASFGGTQFDESLTRCDSRDTTPLQEWRVVFRPIAAVDVDLWKSER